MEQVFEVITEEGHRLRFDADGLDLYQSDEWRVRVHKSKSRTYSYLVKGHDRLFHREFTGAVKGVVVDHRDGDGLNNLRSNLRICTHAQNLWNRRPNVGRTLPKGVCFNAARGTYFVQIQANGVRRAKHGIRTVEAAAAQYRDWALELHGEFANFSPLTSSERSKAAPKVPAEQGA